MNEMTRMGKIPIAYSFSETLDQMEMLGASFFSSHTLPKCRDVDWIFLTIAYGLA